MTKFKLKFADGRMTDYESPQMALMDLQDARPSGVAKNFQGDTVTPQTLDWPVHDGLLFTFWENTDTTPDYWFAQLITP